MKTYKQKKCFIYLNVTLFLIREMEALGLSNFDFKDTAEKYKKEMMKLYGAKSPVESESAVPTVSSPPERLPQTPMPEMLSERLPQPLMPEMPPQLPMPEMPPERPQPPPIPEMPFQSILSEEIDIDKKYPPPVIPDFILSENNRDTAYGYLKVNVRTGNGGLPLEGSLVTVSEIRDGKEHIIKLMTTDSSGSTETLRLPAPLQTADDTPQDYEKFSKYNISVYSKGYFRESSVDAPVFANITSVQTFYLIPEPFDYNSGERNIIDRNPEPEI